MCVSGVHGARVPWRRPHHSAPMTPHPSQLARVCPDRDTEEMLKSVRALLLIPGLPWR